MSAEAARSVMYHARMEVMEGEGEMRPYVALSLRRSSLCRSFSPSIAPYTITFFSFSFSLF